MSTKVCHLIAEQRTRMRSPFNERKNLFKDVSKAKKLLFGPVDHKECLDFLRREHELQSKVNSQKWDFDFAKGRPMSPDPNGRYEWSQVMLAKRPPPPPLRKRDVIDEHDNSDLYCEPDAIERATPIREDDPACTKDVSDNGKIRNNENTRQSLLTDYMPARKRDVNSAFVKKVNDASVAPRPSKMARSSDVVS